MSSDWYLMATHEWNRQATAAVDTLDGWRDRYAEWAERRDVDVPDKITVDDLAEWAKHGMMTAAFVAVPLDCPAIEQARALIADLPGDLTDAAEWELSRFWGGHHADNFGDLYDAEDEG